MDVRRITQRILDRASQAHSPDRAPPGEPPSPDVLISEPQPAIADRNVFVFEAYRAILRRDPTREESLREARRLRFLPFLYTRSRFLARLRESLEATLLENRDRAAREATEAHRFAKLEQAHAQNHAQLKALQRSLSAVSYGIVDELRGPMTALATEILQCLRSGERPPGETQPVREGSS